MLKYYIDDNGKYLGGTDGAPLSANEVPSAPSDARAVWNGSEWLEPINTVNYSAQMIGSLYDDAMRVLQNGYSDEEVKTFTPKQDAIREYLVGGVAGLSAENRTMLENLTGSTDDLIIAAKLENMAKASETFKLYLGTIERLRDEHLSQLVDGQDNTAIVNNLAQAYAALGG